MEATQHVEAVIEGIVSRVRCICGHRRRLPALQSGRESVVWGYRRAFGNISCPTARTGRNVPGFVEKMWSSTARQRFRKQSFESCMLDLSDSCEDPGDVPNLKRKATGFPGSREVIGKIGEMSLYR